MEDEVRRELRRLERLLNDIEQNTASVWWRLLLNGLLYGVGIVIGTVLGIALLGWILSLFGVIPGFGEMTARLQMILSRQY